jgi:acetyltransferase
MHQLRRVALVNPRYSEIDGIRWHATVDKLGFTPELAVIATPPHTVPQLVSELVAKECCAAVMISGHER